MTLPEWTRKETFWSRHYEVAEQIEDTIEEVLEAECQKWLAELEKGSD